MGETIPNSGTKHREGTFFLVEEVRTKGTWRRPFSAERR